MKSGEDKLEPVRRGGGQRRRPRRQTPRQGQAKQTLPQTLKVASRLRKEGGRESNLRCLTDIRVSNGFTKASGYLAYMRISGYAGQISGWHHDVG